MPFVPELPARVQVAEVISARSGVVGRTLDWDRRRPGVDVIRTMKGDVVRLFSDGGQSTPSPGWVLMLTGGNSAEGYEWTLYGLPAGLRH